MKFFISSLLLFILLIHFISTSENHPYSEEVDGYQKSFHQPNLLFPLYKVIKQEEFLADFELISSIGGGGEASVFKVKDKKTNRFYAFVLYDEMYLHEEKRDKIALSKPDHRKLFIERMLENQEVNLHQAKIYAYFWVMNPNYPFFGDIKKGVYVFDNLREGCILNDFYRDDPDALIYRHEAFLLELGLGDLEGKEFKSLQFDPIDENLILELSRYGFYKGNIITSDNKSRNYIFVSTSGQTYQKQEMDAFDYWHYQVESLDIYLPRPDHIIKRIDYGAWSSSPNSLNPPTTPFLTGLSRRCEVDEEVLFRRFCQKPINSSARILNIKF